MKSTSAGKFGSEQPAEAVRALLLGKVVTGRREQLCRIRTVSRAGLTLESRGRIAAGRYVRVQLRNGREVRGSVIWSESDRTELRFDAPMDPKTLLGSVSGNQTARAPRIAAGVSVRISANGRVAAAKIVDLSQSGARVTTRVRLASGDSLTLSIPDLGSFAGVVRRAQADEAGIALLQPIGFDQLACWADKYLTSRG